MLLNLIALNVDWLCSEGCRFDPPNQQQLLPLQRDFFSKLIIQVGQLVKGCIQGPGWGGIYPPQLLSGYASIGKVVNWWYNITAQTHSYLSFLTPVIILL